MSTPAEIAAMYYTSIDHLEQVRKAMETVKALEGTEVPDSPAFVIVGKMSQIVKEAEERYEAALDALAEYQKGQQ